MASFSSHSKNCEQNLADAVNNAMEARLCLYVAHNTRIHLHIL